MANLNQRIQSNATNPIVANMVKPSALNGSNASTGPSFQDNMTQALKRREAQQDPYNKPVSTPVMASANTTSAPSMTEAHASSPEKSKKFGALMNVPKPNVSKQQSPIQGNNGLAWGRVDSGQGPELLDLSTDELIDKISQLSALGFDALGNDKGKTSAQDTLETGTESTSDLAVTSDTGLISPEAMLAQLNALNAKNSAAPSQTVTEKISDPAKPMSLASARLENPLQNNEGLLDKLSPTTEDPSTSRASNTVSNDTFSDTLAQVGLGNAKAEYTEPLTTTLTARERTVLQDQLKEGNPSINNSVSLTQVSLQQAPVPAMVAKDTIAPRFGSEGWNMAVQQKVVWMVGQEQQSASLTLNPPDLGPLQIVINVSNDQANASFFSDNQDVRQALQDGMDNLRQSMKEAGIQLGQTNVGEQQQQNMAQHQAGLKPTSNAQNSASQQATIEPPAKGLSRISQGLLDTFA